MAALTIRKSSTHNYVFTFGNVSVILDHQETVDFPIVKSDMEIVASAAAIVWQRHSTAPKQISITLYDDFVHDDGRVAAMTGAYYPDSDKIGLAVNGIMGTIGLSPVEVMVLFVAHEVTHMIQRDQGAPGGAAIECHTYDETPGEIEANINSMDAFAAIFPYKPIGITGPNGSPSYSTPAHSSYTPLIRALKLSP